MPKQVRRELTEDGVFEETWQLVKREKVSSESEALDVIKNELKQVQLEFIKREFKQNLNIVNSISNRILNSLKNKNLLK